MKKLLRALKQWTLLIAIVVGAVGHSFFSQFTWLAPWLLASMLLLTFCNISPRDLRFHPLHLILMSLQIVMSLGLYALTLPWHPAIAQGVCMAALTPTATAAAIITGMLGGSVAFLAAYAFLSNLAIVVLAPLVLPLIATGQIDTPFLETMSNVFMRVVRYFHDPGCRKLRRVFPHRGHSHTDGQLPPCGHYRQGKGDVKRLPVSAEIPGRSPGFPPSRAFTALPCQWKTCLGRKNQML